jgi:hypothetical protein
MQSEPFDRLLFWKPRERATGPTISAEATWATYAHDTTGTTATTIPLESTRTTASTNSTGTPQPSGSTRPASSTATTGRTVESQEYGVCHVPSAAEIKDDLTGFAPANPAVPTIRREARIHGTDEIASHQDASTRTTCTPRTLSGLSGHIDHSSFNEY